LRTALIALKQIFIDLATEEVTELVGETPEAAAKAAATEINKEVASMVTELKKAIALAGASTDPEMKKMEAHLTEIGKHVDKIAKAHEDMAPHIDALRGGEEDDAASGGKDRKKKDADTEAEKAAAASTLQKASDATAARFSAIEASMVKTNEVLSLIANRLVPTAVAAVAVAKTADVAGAAAPAAITDPTEAIKAAHRAGMTRQIA
jgi:hypothetical protein